MGRVVLDEHASGALAFLLEAVAFGLDGGVVICGADEGDDEIFDCGEELCLFSEYILMIRSGFLHRLVRPHGAGHRPGTPLVAMVSKIR